MKGFFATRIAENVPLAIDKVEEILQIALSSGKHTPDDWKPLGIGQNMERMYIHYINWLNNMPSGEDDLAHLACRALFALQLREEARKDEGQSIVDTVKSKEFQEGLTKSYPKK